MSANRRRHPALRSTLLAVATAAILAACGSSSGNTITPLKTTPTTAGDPTTAVVSVPPPSTTTTAPTGDAAIIAVFMASNQTFFDLARHFPVNPGDPKLARYSSGKQLNFQRQSLTLLSIKNQVDTGTYTIEQPRIDQHLGNAAVVIACSTDGIAVTDARSGLVVTPATNTRAVINDRLDFINGTWMVTDAGVRSGATC